MLPFKYRRVLVLSKRDRHSKFLRLFEDMKTIHFWSCLLFNRMLPRLFIVFFISSIAATLTLNWFAEQVQSRFICTEKEVY